LVDRRRLIRRVNNRFQPRFAFFIRHASTLFSVLSVISALRTAFTKSLLSTGSSPDRSSHHESLQRDLRSLFVYQERFRFCGFDLATSLGGLPLLPGFHSLNPPLFRARSLIFLAQSSHIAA
jgi:hypothetical protein